MNFVVTTASLLLLIHSTVGKFLRVVGGKDAEVIEYPYIVKYDNVVLVMDTYQTTQSCSASVIKPTWTITAAHCKMSSEPFRSSFINIFPFGNIIHDINTRQALHPNLKIDHKIRIGSTVAGEEYQFKDVLNLVEFPGWQDKRRITNGDIMLLRTEPILLDKYGKLSAIDFRALCGHEVFLFGYGLTDAEYKEKKPDLYKKLQVTVVIIKTCDMRESYAIYPTICIAPQCNSHSVMCPGDSGGPIVHPSGIVGIASRTDFSCAKRSKYRSKNAGFYTAVSVYIDWISKVTATD